MKSIKIVVKKHTEGYIAYPLGIQGVVVGEGDTYEEALNEESPCLKAGEDVKVSDLVFTSQLNQLNKNQLLFSASDFRNTT